MFSNPLFKKCLQWGKQQQDELAGALQQLESQKSQKTSFGSLLSKSKFLKFKKHTKALEKEAETLTKQ